MPVGVTRPPLGSNIRSQSAPPTLWVQLQRVPSIDVTISGRTSSTMQRPCAWSGSKQKLSPQAPKAAWSQRWLEPHPTRLSWAWLTAGKAPQCA